MISYLFISTLEMFFFLILVMLFPVVWLIELVSMLIIYCSKNIWHGISFILMYLIYLAFEKWRVLG